MTNKKFISITALTLIALLLVTSIVTFVPAYTTNVNYVERIFPSDRIVNIDIVIAEEDWEDLKENPLDETMYNSTIVIDGEKISNVGLRTKGNSTLNSLAKDDTTDRYSFKIDFDYYDDSKNLYGLTKLNLNNAYQDSSYMKNNLSYQLFKMMGVAVPESSFAYITINGTDWGLYETIEGIEEPYLIKNFGTEYADGDLYKPDGTGSDLKWLGDDYSLYTGMDLKTNKNTTDNSALMAFLNAINNSDGTDLEKYLNVDEALRYFAVNTALVNLDSYQGNLKHNYYLYEIDGVFQILPWDYNLAFGGFGGSNISIDNPTNGTLADRPLLNVLLSNEVYKAKYYEYLTQVSEMFTDGTLKNMIENVTTLIKDYVEKDPTKFCTIEEFYKAVDTTGKYISETETTEKENIEETVNGNKKGFGGMGGGMGATGNLLDTASKISESILKQISGEITVTTSSMGGGGNREGMKRPEDSGMEMNIDERPENSEMEMNIDERPENSEMEMNMPERIENKDEQRGGFGGMGGDKKEFQTTEQIMAIRQQSTIMISISTAIMILAMLSVYVIKRKRFKLQQ